MGTRMRNGLTGMVRLVPLVLLALAGAGCEQSADAQAAPATLVRMGVEPTDSAITALVRAALRADRDVGHLQVKVITSDGNVTLAGSVDDYAQINRLIAVAFGLEGVRRVLTNFQVVATTASAGNAR